MNTQEGYLVHPLTGDTIEPVITALGDTAKTGIPLVVRGMALDRDSLAEPRIIPAHASEVVPMNQPDHPLPEKLSTTSVQFSDPGYARGRGVNNVPTVLVNSIGDTLPTGNPYPVRGKTVPYIQGQTVNALPPSIKDNASFDLKYLDVYHGLYSSQVVSMLEDRFGRIWFGTSGGGASIYDGQSFTHLSREEGLCESMILSMLEDSHGNLWFGSNGEGLISFDGKSFTHYSEKEGLSNGLVQSIFEDNKGNIWFTQGGSICKFSQGTFTNYSRKEGLFSRQVNCILEDSKGTLWLGTQEGILRFEGGEFRRLDGFDRMPVKAILEDRFGNLWFGTAGDGVIRIRGNSIAVLGVDEGLSSNQVESILEDSEGNLWFSTVGEGVSMFDGKSFTQFTVENGLCGRWILPILEDKTGNLWFGSMGGGVSIYNRNSFRHFTEKDGLSIRAIYSMMEDHLGNLWFGTLFGGVNKFDGRTITQFNVREGLNDPTVESLLEDRHGNLWFGYGDRGASKFDGQNFTNYGRRQGLTNAPIGAMVEDRQGNLWFASLGGGIIRYEDENFIHFTAAEGLINNYFESVCEDRQGRLWFGTLGAGVCVYDGTSFTYLTEKEGLSSNHVGCIFEDSRGNLWFGTMTEGAMMYDGERFTCFTEKQGLSGNFIQSIAEDHEGNIWISTDKGLNLIPMGQGPEHMKIQTFGLQDGLIGINFFQNSVLLDTENRLWWGNSKCLTMLDLNNFQLAGNPPDIQIDRVDLNRRMVDFRHLETGDLGLRLDSVVPYFNVPVNLQLPFRFNSLTFHFLGVDWAAPQKVRFSFRVKGVDEDWSTPRTQPFAEYRNLPYGTHEFQVRAMGTAQIWSEPVSFVFSIKRPVWQTWWARAGYLLTLVFLITAIVRWRTSILKRRQAELESIVHDRTEEISDMNDELRQQNLSLASQRDEIQSQKDRIQQQNRAIRDSIEYARRIQTATLPPDEVLQYLLPKHFILYKPLDIVSGDFYWLTQKSGVIIVAVADCTGHGVPGAFMSMLGSALLNEVISKIKVLDPHIILNDLRDQVIRALRQTGGVDEARDGMDIALCVIDLDRLNLQYAGAHHPLYHMRNGKLTELKADPMPIGISSEAGKSFSNHELQLQKDDSIYLFTDGFVDQLGGERRKRFTTGRFKQLLREIQDKIMYDQKMILESRLQEWMGHSGSAAVKHEQIDDILVMGIKF